MLEQRLYPETTLFMLMSVDGKISTGSTDEMDFDKDLANIDNVKEGLQQYYDLEQTTDIWSFNSGRILKKVGINDKKATDIQKSVVSFVIVDNGGHLNKNGLLYLSKWLAHVIIVTTKKDYNNYDLNNIEMIYFDNEIDFKELFKKLKSDFEIDKLTIQSGGTLNSILIRNNLVNKLKIVMAPCIVGGKDTSTLVDGRSLVHESELKHIKSLQLTECNILNDSYIELNYNVLENK